MPNRMSLQPDAVHTPRAIGEEPSTRSKATSYENAPFVDQAWDASAAVGRLKKWAGITGDVADATPAQRAKFAKGFAGVRDDGKTQSDYVLPHHDIVGGKFVTIPAGVSAALARVDQTQGFSSSERAAMRKHLEAHRDEWQKQQGKKTASDDGDVIVFRLSSVELGVVKFDAADGDGPVKSWIQVAKVGKFRGHPQGAFEFTPEVFDQIIKNFRRTANQRVPLDFEHATELPGSDGAIPSSGAPATGWITDLRNGGAEGLFGLVEWLEPGLSYVREGRYKFFSPAVQFDAIDPVSGQRIGPSLTSGALTNRPFLDGMIPLAATARRAANESTRNPAQGATTMADQEAMRASAEDETQDLRRARRMNDEAVGSGERSPSGNTQEPPKLYRFAAAMGLDPDAHEDAIHEHLKKLVAEHKDMKARLDKMEASAKEAEAKKAKADVGKLVTLKVIPAEEKSVAAALKLRTADPESFAALYGAKLEAGEQSARMAVDTSSLDARLLLSQIAPNHGNAPMPIGDAPAMSVKLTGREHSTTVHARALELMQADKALTYTAAATRASSEIKRLVSQKGAA